MNTDFNIAIQWSSISALQHALQLLVDESSQNPYHEGYRIFRTLALSWVYDNMELYSIRIWVLCWVHNPLTQAPFQDSAAWVPYLGSSHLSVCTFHNCRSLIYYSHTPLIWLPASSDLKKYIYLLLCDYENNTKLSSLFLFQLFLEL